MAAGTAVLDVDGLRTEFHTRSGSVTAVDGVSLRVESGERIAVVGESGCGKTTLALSILRLLPEQGRVTAGAIRFQGRDLLALPDDQLRSVRGRDLSMTFQDSLRAMNPLMRVGTQIQEVMTAQRRAPTRESARRVIPLMTSVSIPAAAERARDYPYQFSGGMRQRAMVAMGIANEPALLVADEPTTALDVTVQAQIVDLLERLNEELGTAIVLITHDMGLVADLCQRVVVMYAGRVVEDGPVGSVLSDPQHPYTWSLLRAIRERGSARTRRVGTLPGTPPEMGRLPPGCKFNPRCPFVEDRCTEAEPGLVVVGNGHTARCWVLMTNVATGGIAGAPTVSGHSAPEASKSRAGEPLLEMEQVAKHFAGPSLGRPIRAVDGVSLQLWPGETVGLIGESGSGKSTLARLVVRLLLPTSGTVRFEGKNLAALRGGALREVRRRLQMVFQDPSSSFDPRLTVSEIIVEPLLNYPNGGKKDVNSAVASLLDMVGLSRSTMPRHAHELSGGQSQRVGIARALALRPALVVCDEAVSSLDVSVQGHILNLLSELGEQLGLSYLFISHDLSVIEHLADSVAVMYLGKIVESGPTEQLFRRPQHPYTMALLAARSGVGSHRRPRNIISGELPSPAAPPEGCRFHPRCPIARSPGVCDSDEPGLVTRGQPPHPVACHFAGERAF